MLSCDTATSLHVGAYATRVANNQFNLPSGFTRLPNKGRVKPV
jgi:hypothetical protein